MVHDSSDIEDNSSSDLATEWLIGTRLAAMGPLLVRRRHASSLRLPGQGPCARTHGIKHPWHSRPAPQAARARFTVFLARGDWL